MRMMDEQNLVTQANPLIRGRKRDGITLREQKILYTVISMIDKDDEELKEYVINVRQLFKLSGVSRNAPAASLRETADKLTTRNFEIPYGKNVGAGKFISIVASCEYVDNEGILVVTLNPIIKPFLLKLQRDFTSYKLFNILKLRSEHSIALFQYFKSYAFQTKVTVTLDDLRIFLFNDVNVYTQYSYFKRDVLNKCLKEIEEKTDITVTMEEHRTGRKVHSITFHIESDDVIVPPQNLIDTEIWDEKKVITSLIADTLRGGGIEISATDAASLAEQSLTIWKDSTAELVEVLNQVCAEKARLNTPIGYLKYLFKQFKENIEHNLAWNQGIVIGKPPVSGKSEKLPEWFNDHENEPNEQSEEEKAYIERERELLKKKLEELRSGT